MKSALKRANPGASKTASKSKSVRWSEALEKSLWFHEDAAPSETTESLKPTSTLKFSALSKSKKVEKLGDGNNLFNLPVQSKKTNYMINVPQPTSTAFAKSTFVAAAPLVSSNPTIVVNTDWKEAVDASSQETYYYHSKTNATTWEMPPEYKKYKEYLANKDKIAAARKAKFAAKLRESKGEGLLLKNKLAMENEDDEIYSSGVEQGEINVPSDLKQPKEKKKHQTILLAARKFKESSQFEFILKLKQANNPDFAFLNEGNEFYPYYEWLKQGTHEARVSAKLKDDERKEEEAKKQEAARKGPVGLLGAAYSSDDDSEEDDDDDSSVGGGVLLPPAEVKETIKTMVSFVLKNGLPFEETVREREKHRDTIKFAFLQKNSPYYPFYVKERDAAIKARDAETLEGEMDELDRAVTNTKPPDMETEVANFHLTYLTLYEGESCLGQNALDANDQIGANEVAPSMEIWSQYANTKEAAALVSDRVDIINEVKADPKTIADDENEVLKKMREAHALIIASHDGANDEHVVVENSTAAAAIEGIKKRSRQSKFDVEAEKRSMKDEKMTQEEKDELRKKRLKRAKMMSGHLKLKMLETQDEVEKKKEKEKEKELEKKTEQNERNSSSDDESSDSYSRDRHRDRDRRRDGKHRHRNRDRDRDRGRRNDRDRNRDRDRDRDRSSRGGRKHDRKRPRRSKRSRSRSSS